MQIGTDSLVNGIDFDFSGARVLITGGSTGM